MESHGQFKVISETRDDAAGEAYDKVFAQLPSISRRTSY